MRRLVRMLALPVLSGLALAACSGAGQNAETSLEHTVENGMQGYVGTIQVHDAYLVPGTTGHASLYLSLYNSGSQTDTLTTVTTPVAASVALPSGGIPVPGGNGILLLESPKKALRLSGVNTPLLLGSQVKVTMTFTDAGTVTLQVPVEGPNGQAPIPSPSA